MVSTVSLPWRGGCSSRPPEFIVGGARHLKLAGSPTCETLVWPSPISEAIAPILARRGKRVVVVASGDPFFYGLAR